MGALSDEQKKEIGRVGAEKHNRLHKNQIVYEESVSVLNDLMNTLAENGIRPVVVIPSFTEFYRDCLDKRYKEELLAVLDQMQIPVDYYDLNEMDFFEESDFFDSDHLNNDGAQKLTTVIEDIVEAIDK